MNLVHLHFDAIGRQETGSFVHSDGSQLARPFIHVLKQMTVDRLEMGKVEVSFGAPLCQALFNKATFSALKLFFVLNAKLISKHVCAWVKVVFPAGHDPASIFWLLGGALCRL